jgi:hypothetical protein
MPPDKLFKGCLVVARQESVQQRAIRLLACFLVLGQVPNVPGDCPKLDGGHHDLHPKALALC